MKKISRVIGFAGRMRNGKTQSALYLVDKYDYVKLSCAGALKKLCANLLNIDLDRLNQMKNDNVPIQIQPDEMWTKTIANAIGVDKDMVAHDLEGVIFKDIPESGELTLKKNVTCNIPLDGYLPQNWSRYKE